MKIIKRFYEDDLRELVARELNVNEKSLISVYTEEPHGYGENEHVEPVFYIEYIEGVKA